MAIATTFLHHTIKKSVARAILTLQHNNLSHEYVTKSPKPCLSNVDCRSISITKTKLSDHAPDYYSTLGVSRSADIKTIKLAYFNLAKKFHPDSNKSEEARLMFRLAAEAYDVLSDERKRANYDEYGTTGHTYGGKASGPQRSSSSASQTYDSEELFMKIFGESIGRDANAAYQSDKEYNDMGYDGFDATHEFVLPISFEDATRGCIQHIELTLRVICLKCQGSKSLWGYQSNVCPYCEGTGVETEKIGHVMTRKTCSYCDGTRLFNKWKCDECAGTGEMITSVPNYEVTIPPGTVDGQYLKVDIDEYYLQCCGPEQPKHFYLKLNVEKDYYFRRDGNDIHTENDISVSQALLGGNLSIKGLYKSDLTLNLPSDPNIDCSHKTLVAPGEGVFISKDLGHGNHYVDIGIKVPTSLTEKQKSLALKIFSSEKLANGIVENGVEHEDSHKYRTNVIDPSECTRLFNRDINK